MGNETSYVYQRASGDIERAASKEEVYALCPVIGRMAIEAPEQAEILLSMALSMQETNDDQNEEKPKLEEVSKDEPKNQPDDIEQLTIKNELAKPQTAKETKNQAEAGLQTVTELAELGAHKTGASRPLEQQPPRLAQMEDEAEKGGQNVQPPSASQGWAKASGGNLPEHSNTTDKPEQMETFVQPMTQKADTAEKTKPSIPVQPEVFESEENSVKTHLEEPRTESQPPVGTATGEELFINEAEDLSQEYEIEEIEIDLPIPEADNDATTLPDAQLEELFEPETVQTYKELVMLIESDKTEQINLEETTDTLTVVQIEHSEIFADGQPVNEFEEYIAEQPAPEEAASLEIIQEQANDQPLEQTLVQLTELLSEADEADPEQGQTELNRILEEIETELLVCYYRQPEAEQPKMRLTPELVDKLLILLRHLGYANPKEALAGLVSQYGLAFLLQALQYMCQLNSEFERQEFITSAVPAAGDDGQEAGLRIGRALFGLIGSLDFEPLPAAVNHPALN